LNLKSFGCGAFETLCPTAFDAPVPASFTVHGCRGRLSRFRPKSTWRSHTAHNFLRPSLAASLHAVILRAMQTAAFFSGLQLRLDDARRANRHAIRKLCSQLSPRLATAKRLELKLARRFNALDYLRTDELGLSRIIADLLNPRSSHGQGAIFLQQLLIQLKEFTQIFSGLDLDRCELSVQVERVITANRRIDIVVEFADAPTKYALAIENKPYAGDQRHQARDYLRYFLEKYQENFLLIYLSPTGEGPSHWSIPALELHANWPNQFAIMAYDQRSTVTESDEFEAFRLPTSLTDWLESCRNACEADRLRWFLDETRRFCRRSFGGHTMTSDLEADAIRDFLFLNPEHFDTALAVFDSWTSIRDEVCERFLKRISARIKTAPALQPYAGDMNVVSTYGGEAKNSNCIWLYRDRWAPYRAINTTKLPHTNARTAIELGNDEKGPNCWYIGVRIPKSKDHLTFRERKRRRHLVKKLATTLDQTGNSDKWWPWRVYFDEDKQHWNALVPALHRECEAKEDGDITRHFVDTFVKIALKAIPVIDKIEA